MRQTMSMQLKYCHIAIFDKKVTYVRDYHVHAIYNIQYNISRESHSLRFAASRILDTRPSFLYCMPLRTNLQRSTRADNSILFVGRRNKTNKIIHIFANLKIKYLNFFKTPDNIIKILPMSTSNSTAILEYNIAPYGFGGPDDIVSDPSEVDFKFTDMFCRIYIFSFLFFSFLFEI
jgi:hypothetical protein